MASSILNSDDGVISGTSGLKSTGGDDGVLVFQSKGTETARITTDNYLRLASGGIQFNGDTAAANALDDYEEGTWTPVPTGWTSITYNNQVGYYTKIGNQVTAWFSIQFSGTSAAATVTITGLPFSVLASRNGGAMTYYDAPLNETTGVLTFASATAVTFYADNDSGALVASNGNAVNKYLIGSVTYQA